MKLLYIMNVKIIYYKKSFILYHLSINQGDIIMKVMLLHILGFGQIIKSNDNYVLTNKLNLSSIINSYKEMIDDINYITKKNIK